MENKLLDPKEIKKFIKEETKKGSLFILEKNLDMCPNNWFDCVMFIALQGIDQNSAYVIIMDDKRTKQVMKLMDKDQIKLCVINISKDKDVPNKMWDIWLMKEKLEDNEHYTKLFVGGENLRKFCDERNIFYKSTKTQDGLLLSGTNMLYQKDPDEDCRIPIKAGVN